MPQQASNSDHSISRKFDNISRLGRQNQSILRKIDSNDTTYCKPDSKIEEYSYYQSYQETQFLPQFNIMQEFTEISNVQNIQKVSELQRDLTLEKILLTMNRNYLQNNSNFKKENTKQQTQFHKKKNNKQYLLQTIPQKDDLIHKYKQFKTKISDFIQILNSNKLQNVQQAVCFIGSSGSGKTSLRLYLQNFTKNQFSSHVKFKKTGSKFLIEHLFDQQKYKINNTYKQQENNCQIYQSQGNFHIQLLGLLSPCNFNQQIFNCIQNSTLFSKKFQIKIVIVIQIGLISSSNGSFFVNFINQLCGIFKLNFQNVINSMLLIVSKIRIEDNYQQMIEQITTDLTRILQNNKNLSLQGKKLIQALIQNQSVLIFPTPNTQTINNCLQITKKKIVKTNFSKIEKKEKISLSEKAATVVNSYISLFNLQIESSLKWIIKVINDYYSQKIQEVQIMEKQLIKLQKIQEKLKLCKDFKLFLKILKQNFRSQFNFQQQIKETYQISSFFSKLCQKQSFYQSFLKEILKEIIQIKNKLQKQISEYYDKKLKEQIQHSLKMIQQKKEDEFYLLKHERMQLEKRMIQEKQRIIYEKSRMIQQKSRIMQIQKIQRQIQLKRILQIRSQPRITYAHQAYQSGEACQVM